MGVGARRASGPADCVGERGTSFAANRASGTPGEPCGVTEVCIPCDLRRRPGLAVRHHDHPCPCACSISSSSGSAAGWFCSAGHRPPRTPTCSSCGTRSPCCAAPIPGPGSTGQTARSSPRSQAPAGKTAGAPAGHPWHRPAVAPPPDRPQLDLPAPDGTASGQRRDRRADRAARHREQRLGVPADPR